MPSEAEPAGKLSLDLAPGDYLVTGACAGVYGAKLTVVKADGVPEAASFECDAPLDRFVRHGGGPLTITDQFLLKSNVREVVFRKPSEAASR